MFQLDHYFRTHDALHFTCLWQFLNSLLWYTRNIKFSVDMDGFQSEHIFINTILMYLWCVCWNLLSGFVGCSGTGSCWEEIGPASTVVRWQKMLLTMFSEVVHMMNTTFPIHRGLLPAGLGLCLGVCIALTASGVWISFCH